MKFIVKGHDGNLHVIERTGFTKGDEICEAPEEAGPDDGDCIDLIEDDQGKVTAVLNLERKAAKEEEYRRRQNE